MSRVSLPTLGRVRRGSNFDSSPGGNARQFRSNLRGLALSLGRLVGLGAAGLPVASFLGLGAATVMLLAVPSAGVIDTCWPSFRSDSFAAVPSIITFVSALQ